MELLAGDRQPMGDADGLVLGFNVGVCPAVKREREGKKERNFTGVGLPRTGFVGSVCGSLPPGRRTLKRESVREHAKERRQIDENGTKRTRRSYEQFVVSGRD